MGYFFFLIFLFFIVAIIARLFIPNNGKWFSDRKTNKMYDLSLYKIKETIMTGSERLFFENCRLVLGPNYDIYPQVNLDKIFKLEYLGDYRRFLIYLRKINQKSVDFLIVKRDTQSPVFAIELDDSTHEREDRKERDDFVNYLFNCQKFPLLRFDSGEYTPEKLKPIFEKYLSYSRDDGMNDIEIVSRYRLKEKE